MLRSLINQHLGRYLITALLGRGGMAAVYRAHDTALQRDVALKVLYPQYSDDQSLIARFKREAVTAAQLEHPHIVPIYDVGEQDGMVYIAMKLLNGRSLADVLYERGTLSMDEVLAVLEPVASALDYAHARGVIHRDIKPGNVLIDAAATAGQPLQISDTSVMLTDFGIAKILDTPGLTTTGALIGTPDYMAPEQIGNRRVDGRADVYALGMLAFRALTGRQAFEGSTQDVLMAHLYNSVPVPSSLNPQLTRAVDEVLLRALAREPDQRYATAGVFAQALRQSASARATDPRGATRQVAAPPVPPSLPRTLPDPRAAVVTARPAEPPQPPAYQRAPTTRSPWAPLFIALLLLVLMGGLTTVFVQAFRGSGQVATPTTGQAAGAGTSEPTALIATETASPTPSASPPPESATATATPELEISPTPDIVVTTVTQVVPVTVVVPPPPPPTTAPPPPTATPTSVPPTATPTITSTPCTIAITRGFGKLYNDNVGVRSRLDCPTGPETPAYATEQYFENGAMYYWLPNDTIYVFVGQDRGTVEVFDKDRTVRLPESTPEANNPNAPLRGFGRVYYGVPEIRAALGAPLTQENVLDPHGVIQEFAGGIMFFTPSYRNAPNKIIFVFYNDGTFERYRDDFPE